ncbi:uncharacterized protein LOC126756583 [Bactrocera neohumeralis]|uniref:uncharacterized protein LOC126756583 n=1 Tax=Bactrocera neohumeralis TaxID=98809 RepID=UPI00216687E6|nr:uncharacterized protein LOC126756583 [Bactrocera neohumeralis]
MLRNSMLRWYTNGSKMSEGIGAGIAGPRTKLSIPMGEFPSIFQAEVFAISRCIEINLHRNYCNEQIAILSDSQAAPKTISFYEIKSQLVQKCRGRLNSLAERNQVHLIWVPGHRGIAGNEPADELARSAASTRMMGPEPFIGVGPHTIKELLRKEEGVGREEHWQQTRGMRHANLLIGGYNLSRFKVVINLLRNKLRLLVVWYTDHCKLNRHLYNMGLSSCENCRFCDLEPETPEHLPIDCTAVSRRMLKALGSMFPDRDRIASLAPGSLLNFINALGLGESRCTPHIQSINQSVSISIKELNHFNRTEPRLRSTHKPVLEQAHFFSQWLESLNRTASIFAAVCSPAHWSINKQIKV